MYKYTNVYICFIFYQLLKTEVIFFNSLSFFANLCCTLTFLVLIF